jgi:hypothetical protein
MQRGSYKIRTNGDLTTRKETISRTSHIHLGLTLQRSQINNVTILWILQVFSWP